MGDIQNNIKTVFLIIIGTIGSIVIFSALVELYNTTLTTTFVRGTITKSIEKSCDFFAQETYIRDGDSGAVFNVVKPIRFSDGTQAVSADFFGEAATQDSIYNKLYVQSNDFKRFIRDNAKYWENLQRLGYGIGKSAPNSILNGDTLGITNEYDKTAGMTYVKEHVTALNSGITYLDRESLANIARWNMTSNFFGGNPDTLHKGNTEIMGANGLDPFDYVMYSGYKIYFNTLAINDIEYKVYDLTTNEGVEGFASQTNIGDIEYWKNTVGLDSEDERRYVCVADIKYGVDMSYDGITPIKKIMQYIIKMSNEGSARAREEGSNGLLSGLQELNDMEEITDRAVETDFIHLRKPGEAMVGSSDTDYSLFDFNGKVTYYIIR